MPFYHDSLSIERHVDVEAKLPPLSFTQFHPSTFAFYMLKEYNEWNFPK